MSVEIFQNHHDRVINTHHSREISLLMSKFRNSVWLFGILSWMFGIVDQVIASFTDGYLSAIEISQLFTAFFFFMSWVCLKPEKGLNSGGVRTLRYLFNRPNYCRDELHQGVARARMLELQEQHMISQEYILPFPYICQIYHLLNLKHLETIHNFSLNNLKILKVSYSQATIVGGMLKFQTVLASPFNAMRIWRQPVVEVELILHTPYTVELSIPVYNNKKIIVIFNVLPLNNIEHRFFIDIYSNLKWPKLLLQMVLHCASCLTLFEDLPYLRKLAERNIDHLVKLSRVSNHETMWLFKRFIDLYGSTIESS